MGSQFWQVKRYFFLEEAKVLWRYWRNPRFALGDLLLTHLFPNPYRTCRLGPYGETPLTTLDKIAQRAALGPQDRILELGAGRGRAALWLSTHIGCSVTALDATPAFARRPRFLSRFIPRLQFQEGRMETADLTGYTVVYHYCFHTDPPPIPPGCRLITFSEPLSDLSILDTFPVSFPWGVTDCFIQCRAT